MGEVLSFGFNLAVSFPGDSKGCKARMVLLPSRITRWGLTGTEGCGGGIRFLAPYLVVWGVRRYI